MARSKHSGRSGFAEQHPGHGHLCHGRRDSRTTQVFFNFGDNSRLDSMGFAPFGKVRDMAPIDALYSEYGEGAPRGNGPAQARVQREGNAYLKAEFPKLDYIVRASVIE